MFSNEKQRNKRERRKERKKKEKKRKKKEGKEGEGDRLGLGRAMCGARPAVGGVGLAQRRALT